MTTSAQIFHALRWNAVVRIAAQACTWLITIFVMRLLSPVDYGLMSIATIALGLCTLVNELGAVPALIQRPEIDERLVRKIFGLVLVSNAILYVIAFASAPYFADFFGDVRLGPIIRVLAVQLIIGALGAVPSVLLQRELKFKLISLIEFGGWIIGGLTTLVLALEGQGVWSLVFGNLVKAVCDAGGLIVITRFRIAPLFNFAGLEMLLSFGMKISAARIVWYLNNNFNGLVIGKFLGNHALGLYSLAETLAWMPTSKVMGLSNQIAFAAYSRIQDDRVRVRNYFLESACLASFLFFPVCWGMSAVAGEFVDVVLGPAWRDAALLLQIIALGVPYRALTPLMAPLVEGLGRPGISLKNTLTTSLIVPAASVVGLYWGLIGLCVASLAGSVLATTINLRRNLVLVGADYGQLLSAVFPSMLAAAVMYAAVLGTRAALLSEMPALWRLPLIVALGALIYGAMTVSFNRHAAIRSLQLIRAAI